MRTVHLFISLALAVLATAHDQVPPGLPDEASIAYITKWKEVAIQKMKEHGIPASITLAQGLLESRSGQSDLTLEARNHFGIKCTPDWTGGKVYHDDDKKDDCFRKYKRDEDSFEDHSKFLMKPRYAGLFELKPTDYKGWAHGLKKAGYATDPRYPAKLIDLIERYCDIFQVGARNMQNFTLLKMAGQTRRPILLKRGMSSTLEEFLLAAEYIMAEGNYQVILCERGIRTFGSHSRFTPDLAVIPAAQKLSHLPVILDPSHSTGTRETVVPMARAGIAIGADGLLVDVHPYPEKALCDGPQALLFPMFKQMVEEVRAIAKIIRH